MTRCKSTAAAFALTPSVGASARAETDEAPPSPHLPKVTGQEDDGLQSLAIATKGLQELLDRIAGEHDVGVLGIDLRESQLAWPCIVNFGANALRVAQRLQ